MRHASHEEIFIREILIHGNKERACRAAFPYMLSEYVPEAIKYMLDNPEILQRIEAGFIYMYREVIKDCEIPDLPPVSIEEKQKFLRRIISGERRKPVYIKLPQRLAMIMAPCSQDEVDDAIHMYHELNELAQFDKMLTFSKM